MNIMEFALVADICRGGGTQTSGKYVMEVDSDWRDGGYVVVYMESNWWKICGGGIW